MTDINYDGNGKLKRYNNVTGLAYDAENHLTQYGANTYAYRWTYGYDGDGLRAWKKSAVTSVGTRFFLYDGTEPVCEFNASGTILAVNTFGANGLLARWTSTAGNQYYLFDSKGNVANYVNASGTATNIGYDAYGKVEGTGSSDPFGYSGQWGYYTENGGRDTGFILCTHRYYDQSTGRWLTRDPIGYEGGVNLYGYVGGDPVNSVDPEGLRDQDDCQADCDEMTNQCLRKCRKLKGILNIFKYFGCVKCCNKSAKELCYSACCGDPSTIFPKKDTEIKAAYKVCSR